MFSSIRPLLGVGEVVCVCVGGICKIHCNLSLPRFPSEHFGKLFGLVMALSAIVSLLQFPLFKVSPESNAVYVSTMQGPFLASLCVGPLTRKVTQAGPIAQGPSRGRSKLAQEAWMC